MKFNSKEIAHIIEGTIEGNPNIEVYSISKIEDGNSGDICFLSNDRYTHFIYNSNASIIIVNNSFKAKKPIKATLIKVADPYSAFRKLIEIYNKNKFDKVGLSKKAEISTETSIGNEVYIGSFTSICKGVIIGNNVKIHTNCYIGENVIIGDNTIIFPNVSIYYNCKLGENNIIHSGAVIGSDGFGFAPNQEKQYKKIHHIGNVEILDNVEIGANTTIDRGTIGLTKIGQGVKLDNLIQIGHNVDIGKNTVIAGLTAIAGSTKIGNNCMIGGSTGVAGHLTIGNNVKIAGHTGVGSNIKDGETIQGPYAFNQKDFLRSYSIFKKLPEMYKTLQNIEKRFQK